MITVKESIIKLCNRVEKAEADKAELAGSLAIALNDKKRKLYKTELIQTLKKHGVEI